MSRKFFTAPSPDCGKKRDEMSLAPGVSVGTGLPGRWEFQRKCGHGGCARPWREGVKAWTPGLWVLH